jgi:RNase P subunit RPR2
MYNKQSCRECGTFLTPHSVCNVCKEHISWICIKCGKAEDVTHDHNYSMAV